MPPTVLSRVLQSNYRFARIEAPVETYQPKALGRDQSKSVFTYRQIVWLTCLGLVLLSRGIDGQGSLCHGGEPGFEQSKTLDGFELQPGFKLEKVAGDSLIHDCFSMTLDSQGRPVVSGPGYIKTLIDDDGDGFYDRAITFTSAPKQGAQGLWCEGARVFWVSEGGIWYADDVNRDFIADQSPRKILDIATGGEHDAHALRKGPDGHWYLIVGNFAANVARLQNDPNSPITRPRGGTLWRISPDFRTRSVWAHGMRNCYDFDFLPDGQIVTFESDCERESSFPWYRPTRVMVLGPGSDAGWCGLTWKDQDEYITMPQVIGAMGRASPTGVATYEHEAFPEHYRGAVFVLDWTFGRVIALYPNRNLPKSKRPGDRIPAEVFLQTTGGVGFAPTDICVASDGSLLVVVGGRGTKGAIYRISSDALPTPKSSVSGAGGMFATSVEQKLITSELAVAAEKLLKTPNPWDAWSTAQWSKQINAPLSNTLFQIAAGDLVPEVMSEAEELDTQRVSTPATNIPLRAAQLLTRLETNIPIKVIENALATDNSQNHAAAWWLMGRGKVNGLTNKPSTWQSFADRHATILELTPWEDHLGVNAARLQLEALGLKRWPIARKLQAELDSSDASRALRRTWLWAASQNPAPLPNQIDLNRLDHLFAKRLFATQTSSIDTPTLDVLGKLAPDLEPDWNRRERLEFLSVLQSALGDRRLTLPTQQEPANLHALDGYRSTFQTSINPKVKSGWEVWLTYIGSKAALDRDDVLANECVRTLALLGPGEATSLSWLLSMMGDRSHPTADINVLCALAKCSSPRSAEQSLTTAKHLLSAFRKLKDYGLATESQWPPRAQQLVKELQINDRALGESMLQLADEYYAEDLQLLPAFSADVQRKAKTQMIRFIQENRPGKWQPEIVRFCSSDLPSSPSLRDSMREATGISRLSSVALDWLTRSPEEGDYEALLDVIEVGESSGITKTWPAFRSLAIIDPPRELKVLAPLALRLGATSSSPSQVEMQQRIREIAKALELTDVPTSNQWQDWRAFLEKLRTDDSESGIETDSQDWTELDWEAKFSTASDLQGSSERGRLIYEQKCLICHGGATSLGPSLSGVTRRFSNQDLAIAIFEPNRDVSDRYRTTKVLTTHDESLSGLLVEENEDSIALLMADGTTRTIARAEIEEISLSTQSMMPTGLLDSHSPQDFADLVKYMRSLQ